MPPVIFFFPNGARAFKIIHSPRAADLIRLNLILLPLLNWSNSDPPGEQDTGIHFTFARTPNVCKPSDNDVI